MVLTENDSMFVMNPSKEKKSKDVDDDLKVKIEELSKLRKSISLDLKSIAMATKISRNQLKNIEALQFDKLPPHPMRESFIDQYCAHIQKINSNS